MHACAKDCAARMIETAFFSYFLTTVSAMNISWSKATFIYPCLVVVYKIWLEQYWKLEIVFQRVWLFAVVPPNWLNICGLFFDIMKVLELIFNFIIMTSLQFSLKCQYQLLESVQIWWCAVETVLNSTESEAPGYALAHYAQNWNNCAMLLCS